MYFAENRFVKALHTVGGKDQYLTERLESVQEHGDKAVGEQGFGRALL